MQGTHKIDFVVSAPGKIILHGEHSVVYGKTAIAVSLNQRTKVTLCEVSRDTLLIELPLISHTLQLSVSETQQLLSQPVPLMPGVAAQHGVTTPEFVDHTRLLASISSYLKHNDGTCTLSNQQKNAEAVLLYLLWGILGTTTVQLAPLHLRVETDLSVGAGMGSSASFCVCIAACFLHYIRMSSANDQNISKDGYKSFKFAGHSCEQFSEDDKHLISSWAYAGEKIIHKNPSGIDNTVCTFGSAVEFQKGSVVKQISGLAALHILLVNSGVPRDTASMVARVAALRDRLPLVAKHVLEAMHQVALAAAGALRQLGEDVGALSTLQELMMVNQALLASLGVSHPQLDAICSAAAELGLSAKLTGAGGGGYAFVLLPPGVTDSVALLRSHLQALGFTCLETELGCPGVVLHQIGSLSS